MKNHLVVNEYVVLRTMLVNGGEKGAGDGAEVCLATGEMAGSPNPMRSLPVLLASTRAFYRGSTETGCTHLVEGNQITVPRHEDHRHVIFDPQKLNGQLGAFHLRHDFVDDSHIKQLGASREQPQRVTRAIASDRGIAELREHHLHHVDELIVVVNHEDRLFFTTSWHLHSWRQADSNRRCVRSWSRGRRPNVPSVRRDYIAGERKGQPFPS